jgi:hypothetical protein
MTAITAAPTGEILYGAHEQALGIEIKKYLTHLAAQLKAPIELSIRARPLSLATDIKSGLLTHEHRFMQREEELAAHEFSDPHNVLSMEAGRHELALFIAELAAPLATNTWAQDVTIDVKIGHGLPAPHAAHGMAMCVAFDCKNGIVRHRFAPAREAGPLACEHEVTIGMSLICRPGQIGYNQIEDDVERTKAMRLSQDDASLFRLTAQTLKLIGNLQSMKDRLFSESEKKALFTAGESMRAYVIILRLKSEAATREAITTVEGLTEQAVTEPGGVPFSDALQQALNGVKHISPALGEAVERLEEALGKTGDAEPHHPNTHLPHSHMEPTPQED